MSTISMRFLTILLALSFSAVAFGQSEDWNVSGAIVYNDDDPDRQTDDGISGFKVATGWNFTETITLEGAFTYSNIEGYYFVAPGVRERGEDKQLDLEAHLLAYYDRGAVFAPYALVGVGYQRANLNVGAIVDNTSGLENNPTALIGAGFKWRLSDSQFSLRSQLGMRKTFDGDGRDFTEFTASLGIQYAFGKGKQERRVYDASEINKDTDRDGVLDMWDECPDTTPGVDVTARGCEIQDMNRDADKDRIPDSRDECPNTPTGVPVDPKGCSLDSDLDGVTTDKDHCPGSRIGAVVDEFGCENDADSDGVLDHVDQCPNSRAGATVDTFGCEQREIINLPGVNFQSGSDLLMPGAEQLIKEVAATLVENDYLKIEVAGHTDSQGDEINNQGLSDRRAKTVFDFLIRYGANEDRLSFKGYGESEPVADNATAGGRAANRRVELRVIRQ